MAKSFYTLEEACEKLSITVEQLKDLVRNGQLRELRDAGKVHYKAEDIDKLSGGPAPSEEADDSLSGSLGGSIGASLSAFDMLSTGELTLEDTGADTGESMELKLAPESDADDQSSGKKSQPTKPKAEAPKKKSGSADPGGSDTDAISLGEDDTAAGADPMSTSDLVLEPAGGEEDSGINLASDQISLDDTATQAGEKDDKEGTVVTSIGISVFDDDEVEQEADPLAQTVVSGGSSGLLGVDATGSGSGLLDLTRESDDTSLGAELLDEIYPADEAEAEMGEETRAGLAEAIPEGEKSAEFVPGDEVAAPAAATATAVRARMEFAPDAWSTALTGALFVGVLIMCIAGLTVAAAVQGVWPSMLETLHENNWMVGAGGAGAAIVAALIGFVLGRRNNG